MCGRQSETAHAAGADADIAIVGNRENRVAGLSPFDPVICLSKCGISGQKEARHGSKGSKSHGGCLPGWKLWASELSQSQQCFRRRKAIYVPPAQLQQTDSIVSESRASIAASLSPVSVTRKPFPKSARIMLPAGFLHTICFNFVCPITFIMECEFM